MAIHGSMTIWVKKQRNREVAAVNCMYNTACTVTFHVYVGWLTSDTYFYNIFICKEKMFVYIVRKPNYLNLAI